MEARNQTAQILVFVQALPAQRLGASIVSNNSMGVQQMSPAERFCFQVFTICIFAIGFMAGWIVRAAI